MDYRSLWWFRTIANCLATRVLGPFLSPRPNNPWHLATGTSRKALALVVHHVPRNQSLLDDGWLCVVPPPGFHSVWVIAFRSCYLKVNIQWILQTAKNRRQHAIVVREIKIVTPKELGIILFSGDNSSYGTQCVTIPRFHTLRHGNHIFCEVKPYFVSIMAFGAAPAALPQSAHNTPFTKLK